MSNFPIGMRVRVRFSDPPRLGYLLAVNGAVGTIVEHFSEVEHFSDAVGIHFDKPVNGYHDCDGKTPHGYGYYLPMDYLTPEEPFSIEKVEEVL